MDGSEARIVRGSISKSIKSSRKARKVANGSEDKSLNNVDKVEREIESLASKAEERWVIAVFTAAKIGVKAGVSVEDMRRAIEQAGELYSARVKG